MNINLKLIDIEVNELPKIYKELDIKYDKEKLTKEDLKILALPYNGEKKDERFKNLPKITSGKINRRDHGHLLEKYKIE